MQLELNHDELTLLEKALIATINKCEKTIKQNYAKGMPTTTMSMANEQRKALLKKLSDYCPLKFEYHDTRDQSQE